MTRGTSQAGARLWRAGACCALLSLCDAAAVAAQQPTWRTCAESARDERCGARGTTRREREDAQALYNAPATRRETAPFTLPRDSVVRGSLAVLGGPVRIAGVVEGSLLVLNGDLLLAPGAVVMGNVAVLGGRVRGADSARVGAVRAEADSVRYVVDNGTLRLDAPLDEVWRLIGRGGPTLGVGMRLALTRTYNRVEGLPVEFGPRLLYHTRAGTVAADLFGIFRSGTKLEWNGNNVGHDARVELRMGASERWTIGGRLFDVVAPVEQWQLSDVEVGLSTFLAHSDYRDYYDRHGGSGLVSYRDGRAFRATLEVSDELWRPRATLNPFSLWRNDEPWRDNPDFDRARYTRGMLRLLYDTRSDPRRPRTGWWLQGEYELGDGRHETYGTETAAPVTATPNTRTVRYGRGMLDLRRYTRLSPSVQLNARLMLGGWLHGDALPLQRRLSLSGPGANTGFAFREAVTSPDRLQCAQAVALPGTPALCDRVMLASVDYRHDIAWIVDLFGGSHMIQPDRSGYGGWVLFSDVSRGWLVKPRTPGLVVPADAARGLDAVQVSAGAGLELGQGGVYVAKALGAPPSRGVQVFVRLFRRY